MASTPNHSFWPQYKALAFWLEPKKQEIVLNFPILYPMQQLKLLALHLKYILYLSTFFHLYYHHPSPNYNGHLSELPLLLSYSCLSEPIFHAKKWFVKMYTRSPYSLIKNIQWFLISFKIKSRLYNITWKSHVGMCLELHHSGHIGFPFIPKTIAIHSAHRTFVLWNIHLSEKLFIQI